jgi:hypothetical protein
VLRMAKYPKLKNFWFPERTEKALNQIKKHYFLSTQAETIRYLIQQEIKRLEARGNGAH